MSGPGHNHGPAFGPGQSWRTYCWSRARRDLLPTLPIEILRSRVKRAREIGLDYKTYASVRAATGRDVIGFLFSSNALRAFLKQPQVPETRAAKLAALQNCQHIALISRPLSPAAFRAANPDTTLGILPAPPPFANWPDTRQIIQAALADTRLPADGVVLIGDTTTERSWSEAARLAGYLPAERYFSAP